MLVLTQAFVLCRKLSYSEEGLGVTILTLQAFVLCRKLSYSEEGLGVTMRRDVRTSQMLSGAIQTVADVNRAAQYSVRQFPHAQDKTRTEFMKLL